MDFFFRFEQPWLLVGALCGVVTAMFYRWRWYRPTMFSYSLGQQLITEKKVSNHFFARVLYAIRVISFSILALLVGKPQLVDSRSNMIVEGVDIIIALDASGSMQLCDYSNDQRSRFDIAKEEAIRFINNRPNDALGLVLFGGIALSRCPLTMDKKILTDILDELSLGDIDADGTLLSTGLLTAINRLKSSQAKSKIIILLTDGEPSHGDANPQAVKEMARQFGIKIYTIGIGSDKDGVFYDNWGFPRQKPKVRVSLLKSLAHDTGGTFFMAENDQDMRSVYETIDKLERTKQESPLYSRYYDLYPWFALAVILMLLCEQILAATIWFSL